MTGLVLVGFIVFIVVLGLVGMVLAGAIGPEPRPFGFAP